jgi:predicted dehydrogenase
MMDMGCHAFGWFRWMLGNRAVKSVWATMDTVRHKARTKGEDNTVCVAEFEGGVIGLAEDGWAKPGGMDDRIEVYGTRGVTFADLFRGNSSSTYSEDGYGYAAEKAGSTKGWTFTIFEEVFNQGIRTSCSTSSSACARTRRRWSRARTPAVLERSMGTRRRVRREGRAAVPSQGHKADRPLEGIAAGARPASRCALDRAGAEPLASTLPTATRAGPAAIQIERGEP